MHRNHEAQLPPVVDRRSFLGVAGAALAGGVLLGACSGDDDDTVSEATTGGTTARWHHRWYAAPSQPTDAVDIVVADDLPELEWDMTTSWPAGLTSLFGTPDNGSGAVGFTQVVSQMTGGRFNISAKQAGELAGPLEVIDVLQSGAVQSGHTASYYYLGKSNAFAFTTAVPFGLTCRQQYAWLYHYRDADGRTGLDVTREFYANAWRDQLPGRKHRLPDGRFLQQGDQLAGRPAGARDADPRSRW